MSEHTPEPWKTTEYGALQPEAGGALIATTCGNSGHFRSTWQADARRIAACVNACAGIPTEVLEAGVVVVPVPECRHPKATLSAVGLMLLQQARAQEAVMSYDAATALRWAAKAIEAALRGEQP